MMNLLKTILTISLLTALSSGANAALVARLGGQAYYDTEADLTWLANAREGGAMTWAAANTWAAGLVVDGVGGWRLPDTLDSGISGCNFSYSGTDCGYNVDTGTGEMANMYYNVLGNLAYYDTVGNGDQPGGGLSNSGPFSNIRSSRFWSATEYAPDTNGVWYFHMGSGYQGGNFEKANSLYAWAVQSGDVSPVPVPAAAWLFGSALLGLVGVGRRKKV